MKTSRTIALQRIAALLFVLSVLILLPIVTYINEFLAADTCMDLGGSYDYQTGNCDHQHDHPYVSFISRHPLLGAWYRRLVPTAALCFWQAQFSAFSRSDLPSTAQQPRQRRSSHRASAPCVLPNSPCPSSRTSSTAVSPCVKCFATLKAEDRPW